MMNANIPNTPQPTKKSWQVATGAALIASLALAGCSATGTNLAASTSGANATSSSSAAASSDSGASSSSLSYTKSGQKLDVKTHYSAKDSQVDASNATAVNLSSPSATTGVSVENGVITINAAGTYKLSGEYSGQIKVEVTKNDKVTLILDNATISNSSGAAINIVQADEVVLYTASGTTNTISDGSSYSATGENDPDAAIYSKADLTLAGEGNLKVTGSYQEGIHTKDGLVIAGGTVDVTAKNTGIKGKDYVDILGGTINVTAQQDGIKSTNSTEDNRGWTRMSGGTVTISAGDDGFKAEHTLEISGGTLNVTKSNEGIEAQYINILDGTVNVTSSDDGINASYTESSSSTTSTSSSQNSQGSANAPGGMGQPPAGSRGGNSNGGGMGNGGPGGMGGGHGTFAVVDAAVNILGGTVTVNANGDGIDSNGVATLSGGTVTVNGPFTGGNTSLDTNGDLLLNGSTVVVANAGDMFEAPASTSTSGYVKVTGSFKQGSTVQVADSSGKVVANYKVSSSSAKLVMVSSSAITKGQSYTVYSTTSSVDANATSVASGAIKVGTVTAS
ncbi:MAG: carbohydrate-binding domain-containing protein [Rothia sp. (in: high G+C Gram-positive bacteria)]|uniref:carbohydrate-binding domain-containing protein n=1 Tax=Rothia sp. (in: high G+C Gram-positive bacteria) TaxID=1885016 RepID=UPI0026DF6ACF|nr:carbohydrate-binding domain-containing protein [Rothia sp. (in: high G+C Gram-positive bacteria)]MDO5749847.1 carbohydrate-binding domain-containing protein [Rothia sp. (in: high G+C Gram-positive bacteria)]